MPVRVSLAEEDNLVAVNQLPFESSSRRRTTKPPILFIKFALVKHCGILRVHMVLLLIVFYRLTISQIVIGFK